MSREVEVLVPDIGDFDAVDVVEILVAPGDRVALEDPLVSLESDKATMEVPSPVAGEVLSVKVSLGDAVGQGSLLIVVAASDEVAAPGGMSELPAASPRAGQAGGSVENTAIGEPASMPSVPFSGGRGVDRPVRAHAAPGVRRDARELGVDLAQVEGHGRAGRVLEADLKNYVRETFEHGGLAGPPAALDRQADVTDLETWRRRIPVPEGQTPPSTLAVVLKALLAAVRAFPDLTGGGARPMHVGVQGRPGIATADSEAPLVVVPHAQALGLRALASALEGSAEPRPAEPVFRLEHRLGGVDGSVHRPDPVRAARERFAVAVGGLEVVPHWTGTAEDALAGDPSAHFEPRVVVSLAVSLAPDLDPEIGPRFLDHWAEILGAPARLLL